MSNPRVISELQAEYGDRVIAFRPRMARALNGITDAIFLQQLMHWCKAEPDGWFWHTAEQIEEETTIKKDAQQAIRKRLMGKGLLEEKREGLPARMYYRLNWLEIANILSRQDTSSSSGGIPQQEAVSDRNIKKNNEMKERDDKKISKRPTKIDENLTLSEDWIRAAKALGIDHDVQWQFDQFMDHHINKQDTAIDWRRSWQTWCRNAIAWGNRGPKLTQGCSAPPPDPAVQRLDYLTTGKWKQNPSDVMRYNGEFGQKNLDREITQIQAMIGNG